MFASEIFNGGYLCRGLNSNHRKLKKRQQLEIHFIKVSQSQASKVSHKYKAVSWSFVSKNQKTSFINIYTKEITRRRDGLVF